MRNLIILISLLFMVSCSTDTMNEDYTITETKQITFNCVTQFTLDSYETRATDDISLMDLYVLDYNFQTKELLQTKYFLTSGLRVQLSLKDNVKHEIYFIMSGGESPILETTQNRIKWNKVGDTFRGLCVIDMSNNTNSYSVTMQRMTAKLVINVMDNPSETIERFTITPDKWFNGLSYNTGLSAYESNNTMSADITYNEEGNLSCECYTISNNIEWNTNITIKAYGKNNKLLGEASLVNAPFSRNKVTTYSGKLFSNSTSKTLFITTDYNWNGINSKTW